MPEGKAKSALPTAFSQAQADAKDQRLRARTNPRTGKLDLPGTPEDYGL